MKEEGLNVDLIKDAEPRMYYKDQIKSHLGRESNTCDYVLKVHDAKYDVALIAKDGEFGTEYEVFYDQWAGSVRDAIGYNTSDRKYGRVEGGIVEETEAGLTDIGKFLQAYSVEAAIESANEQGYSVLDTEFNEETMEVNLTLGVSEF